MLLRLLYTLSTPTVLMFSLQMHHDMQHALLCSESKGHACCSWMRSSSAMFHSCSCISSCSASAAALSAAVCRCICTFTAVLQIWRQRETDMQHLPVSCMRVACSSSSSSSSDSSYLLDLCLPLCFVLTDMQRGCLWGPHTVLDAMSCM